MTIPTTLLDKIDVKAKRETCIVVTLCLFVCVLCLRIKPSTATKHHVAENVVYCLRKVQSE